MTYNVSSGTLSLYTTTTLEGMGKSCGECSPKERIGEWGGAPGTKTEPRYQKH